MEKTILRNKSIGTKVSEEEYEQLEKRAAERGLTLSEWFRELVLAELVADPAEQVILAEVLALRTLFLNLQFRQVQGPLTEAEMRTVIERADAVKRERARERLEAARNRATKNVAEVV